MKKQTAVLMVFSLFVFALLSAFVSCAHAQGFKGGAFAPVAGGGSTSLTSTTILNTSRPNYLVYDSAGSKLTTSSRMRRADDSAFVIDNPTGGAKFSFVAKQAGTVKASIDSSGTVTVTNFDGVNSSIGFGTKTLNAIAEVQSTSFTRNSNNGTVTLYNNNKATAGSAISVQPTFTTAVTSGTVVGLAVAPTMNVGGTTQGIALKVMPVSTTWGSGLNRLISAGTKWGTDHEYFAVDTAGSTFGEKFKITKEGGYAVWVTSYTTIPAGYVCTPDTGINNGSNNSRDVCIAAAGSEVPTGVAYTGGITSTGGWMVVSGIADVIFESTVTRSGYAVALVSNTTAGKCLMSTSAPGVAHDREVGHVLGNTTTDATQRVVVHFR